ncbi:hypothetical protein [Sorangium sp. So ce513]
MQDERWRASYSGGVTGGMALGVRPVALPACWNNGGSIVAEGTVETW